MKNGSFLRHGVGHDNLLNTMNSGKEFPALGSSPSTDDIHYALKVGKWRGTQSTLDVLKVLFAMKHVEQFNFGPLSLDALREVQAEAMEFIEYGCFALPYDEVVFRCTIMFDNKPVGFHLFCVNKVEGDERCIATMGTIHSLDHTLTFRSDNGLKAFAHPTLGKALEITVPKAEIKFWEPFIGPVDPTNKIIENTNGAIITEGSLIAMGLVMILNTKGVFKERSEPPAKPNKMRAAAGRPLLPYTTKIHTAVYNRAIEKGPQGTHASPRPHRRRAHIRRYAKTETREAYNLQIAAMLVNWDGQPLQERKEYVR
jgi:hypothetical protein